MEVKKSKTNASSKKMDGKSLVKFVGDVKQELKRVEWTGKDELKTYTKIVLISTFTFGFLVYFADLIIQGCLNGIHSLVRVIFG